MLGITITVIAFFIPEKENTRTYAFNKENVSIDINLSYCDLVIKRTDKYDVSVKITNPSSKLISVKESDGTLIISDNADAIDIIKNPFRLGYSGFSSIIFSLIRGDRPLVEIFIPHATETSSLSIDLDSSSASIDVGECPVFSVTAKESDITLSKLDTESGVFRFESSSLYLSLPYEEKDVSTLIDSAECEILKNGKADSAFEKHNSALCDIFVFAKNSHISIDFGK